MTHVKCEVYQSFPFKNNFLLLLSFDILQSGYVCIAVSAPASYSINYGDLIMLVYQMFFISNTLLFTSIL